jgi:hypothetical protein
MINKFLIILALALFAVPVFGAELTPIQEIQQTQSAQANQQAQIIQRMNEIQNKVNELPTKAEYETKFNQMATFTRLEVSNSQNLLIIALIMSQLFQIGLAGGLYIYFKMNRRL